MYNMATIIGPRKVNKVMLFNEFRELSGVVLHGRQKEVRLTLDFDYEIAFGQGLNVSMLTKI